MPKNNRFTKSLAAGARKTDNHPSAHPSKVQLRRLVMEAIGADRARVFDAFAGSGVMYRAAWHQAGLGYVGCDLRWFRDGRLAYVADNRRVMRAIDLSSFNVFDLDAYGAPWEQALILADRREVAPGELVGIVLTDGAALNIKLGGMPKALRQIVGLTGVPAGGSRSLHDLLDMAIAGLCRRMRCKVVRRWGASGASGAQVSYAALVLQGLPPRA